VATLPIGPRPDAAFYDQARGLAFIPSGGNGTLAVIRVDGPKNIAVVQTVETQIGARTIAQIPRAGKSTFRRRSSIPGEDGRQAAMQPGSFVVLVVAPEEKK